MAWSFSALSGYETCPRRHWETRIAKRVQDPPGEEAQWGTRLHKVLEDRLKSGQPITGNLSCYEPYAAKVESLKAPTGTLYAERKIALTKDLQPTGYFAKDVWVRAVLDVSIDNGAKLLICDWKTGKQKPSEQLELSAAIGAAVHPKAQVIQTAFIWLKPKTTDIAVVKRDEVGAIWSRFLPRVARMEAAQADGTHEAFPPKPSGLCKRYCPCESCEFHGV